jgi:hypothetical protein
MEQLESDLNTQELIHRLKVTQLTVIHSQPSMVPRTLTTSEGFDAWFTCGSTVNARAGCEIHLRRVNWDPGRITEEDGEPVLKAFPQGHFV